MGAASVRLLHHCDPRGLKGWSIALGGVDVEGGEEGGHQDCGLTDSLTIKSFRAYACKLAFTYENSHKA